MRAVKFLVVVLLCCLAFFLILVLKFNIGTEDTQMTQYQQSYTNDQKAILLAAGMREDQIGKRALVNSEKILLSALDAAQNYMSTKYPGRSFMFTGLDNSVIRDGRYQFLAVAKEPPQETFAVKAQYLSEDNSWHGSDSFYSCLKKMELNTLVEQYLNNSGVAAITDLSIVGLYGNEYSSARSLKETLEEGYLVAVTGRVFISGDISLPALQTESEKNLRALGLSGGFKLCLVEEIDLQEVLKKPRTDTSFIKESVYISLPDKLAR